MADEAKVTAVRLLINDPITQGRALVFNASEVEAFLVMEDGNVKLAAAQALDVIASDQALILKVINDRGLTLDGAKVADALRKHAASLRGQVADAAAAADEGHFTIVDMVPRRRTGPELTERYR